MSNKPGWRRTFDRTERKIATTLEAAIHTEDFANAMALLLRTRRSAGALVDGIRTGVLHLGGLAAVRDVNRLAGSLRRIETQLREVTALVELQSEKTGSGGGDGRT